MCLPERQTTHQQVLDLLLRAPIKQDCSLLPSHTSFLVAGIFLNRSMNLWASSSARLPPDAVEVY